MIPIEKNIIVVDENGTVFESTWLKRANGLVKKGRARWLDADMAFERTALSNSQTLLAYIRTAIAAFAAGIGMFEFVSHPVIIKIGIAFMTVGPIILVVGFVHYFIVRRKMSEWTKKEK